jgi:hypothetical protein
MSSSNLVRWGAIGFVVGGLVWILLNLFTLSQNPAPDNPLALVLYIIAIVLSFLGVVGLHALQKENYGRIGRGGFYTILISNLVTIVGAVAVLFLGIEALIWLAFPVGPLGIIVGFVLYGAATLQARVLPRWYGVALIIFVPVSVALGGYGNIWVGLVQLALGYVLWSRSGTPAEQPSRVR